jgi:hypothetical protein
MSFETKVIAFYTVKSEVILANRFTLSIEALHTEKLIMG